VDRSNQNNKVQIALTNTAGYATVAEFVIEVTKIDLGHKEADRFYRLTAGENATIRYEEVLPAGLRPGRKRINVHASDGIEVDQSINEIIYVI
jgi:hypothetical protein